MDNGRKEPASGPRRTDPSRRVFYLVIGLLLLAFTFILGMASGLQRNGAYRVLSGLVQSVKTVLAETTEGGLAGEPVHFLQPSRHEGSGVTVNLTDDNALVLISGFFDGSNEIRLIERDGTIVARWPVVYSDMLPTGDGRPNTDWKVDIHGVVAMPDGSVVFNWEYNGTVRLSRCGEPLWVLDSLTHHSLERSEAGGFWIPGRRVLPPPDGSAARNLFPPFTSGQRDHGFHDDLILRVSEDGEITSSVSVMQILYDSGLAPVLTSTGSNFTPNSPREIELLHLNKIAELPAAYADAFPDFEAGDIAVSLREYNLIAVIDPSTWRVRWSSVGPWIRQHDPEFLPDGTIAVFDNGGYRTQLGRFDRPRDGLPLTSAILAVDPFTDETTPLYGRKPDEAFRTVIRGKVDPTPGGGLMITEFEAGRIFEVDRTGALVWEFINRFDDARVLEITEGRLYDRDYFEVASWECP